MVEVKLLKPDYIVAGALTASVHFVSEEEAQRLEASGAAQRVVIEVKPAPKTEVKPRIRKAE